MANPCRNHGLLPLALERICLSAPADVVLEVFDEGPMDTIHAALRASASRSDVGLPERLLDRLRDEDELPTGRAKIAEFFGDDEDASTVPALWEVFIEACRLQPVQQAGIVCAL